MNDEEREEVLALLEANKPVLDAMRALSEQIRAVQSKDTKEDTVVTNYLNQLYNNHEGRADTEQDPKTNTKNN